jgi:hypothetical protein
MELFDYSNKRWLVWAWLGPNYFFLFFIFYFLFFIFYFLFFIFYFLFFIFYFSLDKLLNLLNLLKLSLFFGETSLKFNSQYICLDFVAQSFYNLDNLKSEVDT